MQQKDSNLVISYSLGYHDWYVSEFYKFLHSKFEEKYRIKFKFIPIEEFGKKYGVLERTHIFTAFDWYNLIIYNPKTEKYFMPSCHDHSVEALHDGLHRGLDITKFSCVPDTRHSFYSKYKDYIVPSVYRFEMWGDYKKLLDTKNNKSKLDKAYFIGELYGYRENYFNKLNAKDFFVIQNKQNPEHRKSKEKYYEELSKYRFNLSLNGAAGICYRDLEIFGLGNFNLRDTFTCLTHDTIIKDVHYVEMFNEKLNQEIINPNIDSSKEIDIRIEEITGFCNSKEGELMLQNTKEWFANNCDPEKQVNVIDSILEEFTILN